LIIILTTKAIRKDAYPGSLLMALSKALHSGLPQRELFYLIKHGREKPWY